MMRLVVIFTAAFIVSCGAAAQETGPIDRVPTDAQPPRTSLPPPLPPRADGKTPDLAFGAYQRGNFLFALREAERRLDQNHQDAAAMTLIGVIYRDGAAVGKNDLEASRWFRLASNLGDPQAAFELGALLLQGAKGVPKDRELGEGAVRTRRRKKPWGRAL